MSKYGYFDIENKEFVITRPDTPLPWINYLGEKDYCAIISNTAGGYSFYKDPKELRILRYRYNNIPLDRGGRYLYIRDNKSRHYWSATWQPITKWRYPEYQYECRHGLGYTKITSKYEGIKTETTYVVPIGESFEIYMMEITNESSEPRDMSIFSFVEFCLWDALNDMTDFQYNLNIGETDYDDGVIYHLTRYRIDGTYFAFFGCNSKVDSFDSQREDFLGKYGSLDSPKAVREGKCSNSIACGWSPVGSHCVPVKLKPKETKTVIFVLGYSTDKAEPKKIIEKYGTKKAVFKALSDVKYYWESNLNKFATYTPDTDLNLMVNTWHQYQCRTTFNWSRSASYYEAGIGRGMGFRDSNQDTLGFVHQIPGSVKQRIIDLASTQFESGAAAHQYSPLTKKGNGKGYSDDHLWMIFSVASYIKETGDLKFLDEMIPFEGSEKKDKLYKHLELAINYSVNNCGPHGIPRIEFADWNDCLNLNWTSKHNNSESVMVAQMLVAAAKEMVRLAEVSGLTKDMAKYQKIADKFTKQINKVAWDGKWYKRAFDDNKKPVGSSKNKEGKIFLETQGWGVISGVADAKKTKTCLDSVKKHLATENGIMILSPAYKKFHPELGSITVYPPGLKENGAIFCHPNPWIIVAECIAGRGNQAFNYYKAILPAARLESSDKYKVEPYVYCQMIAGKSHKDFGEGKNSWLTGSAAWNFVAVSQWILGVRPDYRGLIIDPCIPKEWKGFTVRRHFRDADYLITVRNPKHVSKGVRQISVDGKRYLGVILPVYGDKREHHVEVIMG